MFTAIFVQPLLNILLGVYAYVGDFGIAVIVLTVLVRLALWPLVTKQLVSQKKLQALQPKIMEARKKANGDRHEETRLMMEVYKEHGTSPFASITPILIQLPIFFALYIVFSDALKPDQIARLAYEPIRELSFISDILSGVRSFEPSLFGAIDLTKSSLILAVAAGIAQFIQTKQLQPKNTEHLDPTARMTMNLTLVFPVITVIVGLTLPSALALYWAFTSIVAIFQQWLVLRREEEDLSAKVTVTEVGQKQIEAATKKPKSGSKKNTAGKKKAKRA